MHPHALRVGKRIAQLKERDVGILRDQLLKESLMRCQLSPATRRALWCGFKLHGTAQAVEDLVAQGAPAFEAATPMLSQFPKAKIAER